MKVASLLVLGFAMVACSSSSSENAIPMARSRALQNMSPDVPAADADVLRDGNTAFALDLHRALAARTPGANLAAPPASTRSTSRALSSPSIDSARRPARSS